MRCPECGESEYAHPEDCWYIDYSQCSYYRRGQPGADPSGTCSFWCSEEPACHTEEPEGGWPQWQPLTWVRTAEF